MAETGVYGNHAASTGKLCGKATERQFRQYGSTGALRNMLGAAAFGLVSPGKQDLEAGAGCARVGLTGSSSLAKVRRTSRKRGEENCFNRPFGRFFCVCW